LIATTLTETAWSLAGEVDCSQLLRAWQTARLIVENLTDRFSAPAQLVEFAELAERSVGIAGNLTVQQIESVITEDPRYPAPPAGWKVNSDYCLPFPGAESLRRAGERVARHLDHRMRQLAKTIEADTLKLFVGHGAAFRHAAFRMGVIDSAQIARLSMHHAVPVYLEYLHGNGWRHVGGEWKIRDHHQPTRD
jgi:broad specificity phosphatase PhoE